MLQSSSPEVGVPSFVWTIELFGLFWRCKKHQVRHKHNSTERFKFWANGQHPLVLCGQLKFSALAQNYVAHIGSKPLRSKSEIKSDASMNEKYKQAASHLWGLCQNMVQHNLGRQLNMFHYSSTSHQHLMFFFSSGPISAVQWLLPAWEKFSTGAATPVV